MTAVDLLLAYDIDTTTSKGRRRLRLVAKLCEGHGQRVQFSVFELVMNDRDYPKLLESLDRLLDSSDNVRIYRLSAGALDSVTVLGTPTNLAHRDAWVL